MERRPATLMVLSLVTHGHLRPSADQATEAAPNEPGTKPEGESVSSKDVRPDQEDLKVEIQRRKES